MEDDELRSSSAYMLIESSFISNILEQKLFETSIKLPHNCDTSILTPLLLIFRLCLSC
jgi:hypothetical protein